MPALHAIYGPGHPHTSAAAVRVAVMRDRALLAGMYCLVDGLRRVDLRDAATGAVLDFRLPDEKPNWCDPPEIFTGVTWRGDAYVLLHRNRPNGYLVLRVTPHGYELTCDARPGWQPETGCARWRRRSSPGARPR